MLFALKKFISGLVYPSSLIFFSLCAGTVCLFFRRRGRVAVFFFSIGLLIALLSFFPPVPDGLMQGLEKQYAPYDCSETLTPQWILVLGHGFKDGDLPETSRVDGEMYARLIEAVRIARSRDSIRFIVSISGDIPADRKTGWWKSFCKNLNLSPDRSVILTEAKDTEEELQQALQFTGTDPFVLVTSASHIPRAMCMARAFGAQAIPAPCNFESHEPPPVYKYLLPSSQNLYRTETALHEYLGLLWFHLTHATGN